ncbi:MAG TPA: mycofactocin system glycosyltransferase, partial [Mycobacteriales bacterium]|nr:mycofactocin system glycosyltransferase [Mycobacteriales bacterium]
MTVPVGWRLQPDVATQCHDGGRVVIGGSPRRVLRLTERGADAARRLLGGDPVSGNGDALLARRLLDAGIAHPVPTSVVAPSVEVVVPVYDDAVGLEPCLAALGADLPVTVVDDGSPDGNLVAAVASAHGARL